MAESIFYTAVEGPDGVIDGRGGIYGSSKRDTGQLQWLTAKQVYASATVVAGGTGGLGVPTGGGFGAKGVYSKAGDDGDDARLIPKSHITSIKISDIGDWGSVKACELAFTCYSIGQLESQMGFCTIGATISVSYGWAGVPDSIGGGGSFKGKVYNFNFSVNNTGGWDCTCKAMAEGIDVVSSNVKAGESGGTTTDPLGNEVPIFDVISRLNAAVAECKDLTKNATQVAQEFTIGCLEYASSWGAAAESGEATSTAADATAKEELKHYYVTLGSFVTVLSKLVVKSTTKLICDADTTKSAAPADPMFLISANPKQVIFSGYNKYGDTHNFDFDVVMGSGPMDSSSIFISIDWLASLVPETGKKEDSAKSADTTISKLLGLVFDSIHENSGNRIALSITQNPDKPDGSEFLVVDVNYAPNKGRVWKLQAFNNTSALRAISLTSKVPNEMASAAFVAPGSPGGSAAGQRYREIVQKSTGTAVPSLKTELEALKKLFDATKPPTPPKGEEPQGIGPTDTNVSSMQALLATVFNLKPDGTGLSMVYPVGLSFTVDGVEGFKFGNTLRCDYLPSQYRDGKVVFTITKVSQDITMTDWTTSIETVCRLPAA
jgi:hypothetical protein